ncbi:natural killer cell receptor 2B4-like isoform X2 [Triplophysa dalaica]|uniref:natural killer cell receptor 2B4-like isoform X2 n=1 Tax=Triplophysa dalaica TaxID=1582913 RepID=UPI0024DFB880|nr:natural killer cell receptor 2B4-like isoform X2 [Triplophysa dalaica]
MNIFIFFGCLIFVVNGVFGDEVKSVSVMEGESVTLHTDIQREDGIKWYYGPENTVVAMINGVASSTNISNDERFIDRVMMDNQTGDLIITHITSQNSGLYKLRISRNKKVSYKNFNLTVYSHLPVPVISRVSSSERSNCSVLCSVMNVSHDVSVSWYKGKSLLSSISVSDLNIRLSLPLEVEYQDTNTYRCVVNNPITNLTQHLHITQLCHMSSDSPPVWVIIISVVFALLICVIFIIIIIILKRKHHKGLIKTSDGEVPQTDEESSIDSSSTSEGEAVMFLNRPAASINMFCAKYTKKKQEIHMQETTD